MRRLFSIEFLVILIPALALCVAAVWFTLKWVQPAPPDSFVIATSSKGSPYYELALRLQEQIQKKEKNGVKVEVRESQGSFDNLKGLLDVHSDIQAGVVQGGLTNHVEARSLYSMGRLITEPVWIFYRGAQNIDHITQLKGKRILIGPEGGGTSFLAKKLLEANGVTAQNSTLISTELPDYVDAFASGKADAGFLVIGAEAKTVQKLLRQPETKLMNLAQANALIQRYPYLSVVTLRQGVIDFSQNIPPADTSLVATKAALLVREDLHPALKAVLAQAVLAVQSKPALTQTGESKLFALGAEALPDDPEFPMVDETKRMYKSGPTLFQRALPFWLATLIDRAYILILPVVGIIFPLFRIVPWIYNWRIKQRIFRWYRKLKILERDLSKAKVSPGFLARKEQELEKIEESVWHLSVPLQFSADLYTLRDHVEFVHKRIAFIRESHANKAAAETAPVAAEPTPVAAG